MRWSDGIDERRSGDDCHVAFAMRGGRLGHPDTTEDDGDREVVVRGSLDEESRYGITRMGGGKGGERKEKVPSPLPSIAFHVSVVKHVNPHSRTVPLSR